MADRTGMAKGTLRPCVYFSRYSDMYVILPPMEIGKGTELARMVYERRYKREWLWCEATTLAELDTLQKRLVNQELFEAQKKIAVNDLMRERVHRATGDALQRQLVSSETSEWEKDAIRAYLKLRGEKRDMYRQAIEHRNMFLQAREMDSKSPIQDYIATEEGQFERTASGGTPVEVLKHIEEHNARVEQLREANV